MIDDLGLDKISDAFFQVELMRIGFHLFVGGVLAMYLGFLYRRCSSSVSNVDTISGIFPLLTLVTICVISVVKTSLALSLGLVGALSIVRFRAAIKDPEELVYLFFCIALGVALGADKLAVAVVLVFVASVFILGFRYLGSGKKPHNLLLTISGDAKKYFDDPTSGALRVIKDLTEKFSIQRYDVEDSRGLMRVVVGKSGSDETAALIATLRKRLPGCDISYVSLNDVL